MYKLLIRPILFAINPETVHYLVAGALKFLFLLPGAKSVTKRIFTYNNPALETRLFGITFPNKVGLAAGFDKNADLYNDISAFGFGHVEIGTVNPRAQIGNPKPRLFRLKKDKALINRMGFNNPGVDVYVKNLIRNRPGVIIGGNIGKNTDTPNENAPDDYLICYEKLYDWVDYFVVNVSCPNIEDLHKLQQKNELFKILSAISQANNKKEKRKPLLLKISPDLNNAQLDDTLELAMNAGIDGIIATNTTIARDSITDCPQKINKIGNGGLSGKPLNERSTWVIRYLHEKSGGKLPIIASGGIMSVEDAIEKIKAGASLVQIYTGFIYEGPSLARRINKAIARISVLP